MELDLSLANERIQASYSTHKVVETVFKTEKSQAAFIGGIKALAQEGTVKVGGRRPRELLGCKVIDLSKHIVDDVDMLDEHQTLRLSLLTSVLRAYPEERMSKPDLDFFVEGLQLESVADVFQSNGLEIRRCVTSSGIELIEVSGDEGVASFADATDPLQVQTQPPWPMYGITCPLDYASDEFHLDISYGRMYLYPLEFSGQGSPSRDPLEIKRFSAVARALLWAVTATNPKGRFLETPCEATQRVMVDSVSRLYNLLHVIREDVNLAARYRSSLRDMAIALRIIELSDWQRAKIEWGIEPNRADFLSRIGSAWWIGRSSSDYSATAFKY